MKWDSVLLTICRKLQSKLKPMYNDHLKKLEVIQMWSFSEVASKKYYSFWLAKAQTVVDAFYNFVLFI